MTDAEKREAARQFYNKWVNKGKEDEDDRSYWIDILERILGVANSTDRINFQKKVIVDGNTKKIDAYIPETRVLIEQKSLGIQLDKKLHQSGGIELTPYEQAKRYNDNLPFDEKARWIVTSNFAEIWIYDMNMRVPEPVKLNLIDLQSKYTLLEFLTDKELNKVNEEMEISVKAGELVGIIYDALYKQYINPESDRALKSLNALCVRLVFCLYAEDAGIFSNNRRMFHDYLKRYNATEMRKALIELFKVLDTKPEDRDPYDTSDLSKFPYVNGGLFADENIEIPNFTEEIKNILLANASDDFDWSSISPTIFGAVFESTLNPETRRAGGMHYTSIENIHKVIDPLFLNDLLQEFEDISKIQIDKTKEKKLKVLQTKLANLKWLDPACGSGNFLTETYISIRRIENKIISQLQALKKKQVAGQIVFGEATNPIQVSINQFYGIEINDFAVTVAKTALWIAESQMMKETEDVVHMNLDFLPLKTNAYIVEGNALKMDWNNVIPSYELDYIMGNPPFVGIRHSGEDHRGDLKKVLSAIKKAGSLDYVTAWYVKAVEMMKTNSMIRTAFVSTNSIVQGEQAYTLWNYVINEHSQNINFAYQTFKWDSEAKEKASVHCVIIGFSRQKAQPCKVFKNGDRLVLCDNINEYLLPMENIWLKKTSKPKTKRPEMVKGCYPTDGGNYIFTPEEKSEFIKKEPGSEKYFRRWIGSEDMLNGKERYILFLKECPPNELNKMPLVLERVKNVKEVRAKSTKEATRKKAETPLLLDEERIPTSEFLVIPVVSSENRRYIPMEYHCPPDICYASCFFMENVSLYLFGILMSNVHNAWMRMVCGRLKSDYRYSNTLVYNNLPLPDPTEGQKLKIEKTAQGILNARALYPNSTLADLYDPLTMPPELQKAHNANNKAVMQAYGFSVRDMSEEDCVVELMKIYKKSNK